MRCRGAARQVDNGTRPAQASFIERLTKGHQTGYVPPQQPSRKEPLMTTVMTTAHRTATELYLKDLQAEFKENQVMLWTARDLDDRDAYLACADKSDSLFAELLGVGRALRTGVLPINADSYR